MKGSCGEEKKEHKQIHIEPKNFFGICVVVSLVLLLAVVPYYGYLKMGVHKLQKERSEKQYLADEYKEYNQAKTEYEKRLKISIKRLRQHQKESVISLMNWKKEYAK